VRCLLGVGGVWLPQKRRGSLILRFCLAGAGIVPLPLVCLGARLRVGRRLEQGSPGEPARDRSDRPKVLVLAQWTVTGDELVGLKAVDAWALDPVADQRRLVGVHRRHVAPTSGGTPSHTGKGPAAHSSRRARRLSLPFHSPSLTGRLRQAAHSQLGVGVLSQSARPFAWHAVLYLPARWCRKESFVVARPCWACVVCPAVPGAGVLATRVDAVWRCRRAGRGVHLAFFAVPLDVDQLSWRVEQEEGTEGAVESGPAPDGAAAGDPQPARRRASAAGAGAGSSRDLLMGRVRRLARCGAG
jgi:hypothetical protein